VTEARQRSRRSIGPPSEPVTTRTCTEGAAAVERRAAALRNAAEAKHAAALQRAETGLRRLLTDGAEINFRSVSRAGSVSLDFLYAQPELRRRIEGLRAQQQATVRPSRAEPEPDPNCNGNVLRTLTAQLKAERSARLEQVRDLEAKLASAHGEILRLRRLVEGAGLRR
jgi:hypothetical protein